MSEGTMSDESVPDPESSMEILAALFIDEIDFRQVAGPATRIDLGGVQFSGAASQEGPHLWAPHLVVLVRAGAEHAGAAVLEVRFLVGDEQVARSVQPLQVDPGKFGYRLVRAEIDIPSTPYTVHAHVRLDQGPVMVVPYTVLDHASEAAD